MAVIIWLWVLWNIVSSVQAANNKYDYPTALVAEIKAQINKEAFVDGCLGDGFHVRHVMLNVVTDYAERYPEVDFHRQRIFAELADLALVGEGNA